jgi:hypothetical protein
MKKGGMMKRFLIVLCAIILFVACDYASESTKLSPDIECVFMTPVGWYLAVGDTAATITETWFVPESSVDCYLEKLVFEYLDEDDNQFFGPDEMALYMKIEGKTNAGCCDTAILYNVSLPLLPVLDHLSPGESAYALLHYIFVDEYWGSRYDTVTVWFGFYMFPAD